MGAYRLPVFSGGLFLLIFYPFYFWPLACVALVPFFYFAADKARSKKELWWGGVITGVLLSAPILYFSLVQLLPGQGSPFFIIVIRLLSIPSALMIGGLFGLLALSYNRLRTRSHVFNALVGASLYLIIDGILFWVYGGYWLGSLSHAVVPFAPALTIASIGGIQLLSFVIIFVNSIFAETIYAFYERGVKGVLVAVCSLFFIALACGISNVYTNPPKEPANSLNVALIQVAPRSLADLRFGTQQGKDFSDPSLQQLISEAAQGSSLVIYPLSPVDGVTYVGEKPELPTVQDAVEDSAVGNWLASFVTASTTVLIWDTIHKEGNLYDEYSLWNGGKKLAYQKNRLYALSDYTPTWVRAFGVQKSPITITPAPVQEPITINNIPIEGLICSELHQSDYAKEQASRASLIVAVGFDSFFPGNLIGNFSLAAARLRAAENGVPVIRSNFFGPSAFIDSSGHIEKSLPYNFSGILRESAKVDKRTTLYSRTGAAPIYIFIYGCIALAVFLQVRSRKIAKRN